eukprot:CAMPEP_0176505334 /NCGR_PEP_ID=MMETSP0200_2-20121128/16439_1 /TAXON_ID=947934 /ORGANISM="Chaetoceros sp., Strain GSL56" /LENGTH=659 /DNA_ID=CAMNT_0017904881 /DNA_START=1193 /DNA_END=3169 /DNA_ORIENTATION=+
MAKTSNPIQDYNRQQRKKEKKKNKVKRISARDTKVAQTASLDGIQKEIQNLTKKQEHQNGHLDTTDTRKLERLRKELKIVIQAEEERKKQREEREREEWEAQKERMKTKEGVDELNKNKFRNARASIYYDPVMNPFGAPPPGQPMVYHRRGGGQTMDPNEAFIPYEFREKDHEDDNDDDEVLSVKDGRGPLEMNNRQEPGIDQHGMALHTVERKGSTIMAVSDSFIPPPPPPPPPAARLHEFISPPPPPPPPQLASRPNEYIPPPPPPPPPRLKESIVPPPPHPPQHASKAKISSVPSLPAPSESVQRLQRQKSKKNNKKATTLLADIWASQEEIDYEGGETLEGAIDAIPHRIGNVSDAQPSYKRKRKMESKEDTFDPLCPADDGYSDYRSKEQIQRSTLLSQKKKREEGHVEGEEKDVSSGDANEKKNFTKNVTPSCQWYYIDQSGYVQGPFASEQIMAWNQAGFFPSNTLVKNGQDGRFVEIGLVDLATGRSAEEDPTEDYDDDDDDDDENVEEEGVEDRIAMLKQCMLKDRETCDSVEDRIRVLKNTMEEERTHATTNNVEDRIAALKESGPVVLKSINSSIEDHDHEEPPAYPVEAPYIDDQEEPPTYPTEALYDYNQEEPPAYPIDASYDYNQGGPPAYPVDESYDYNQEEPP